MKSFFKPLSRRDAIFAFIVITALLIYGVVDVVKMVQEGLTFDEMRGTILMMFLGLIIDAGMFTIAFTKDKKKEGEDAQQEGLELEAEVVEVTSEAPDPGNAADTSEPSGSDTDAEDAEA